ncbi:glycosyltransferase family 49 protein [Daedalea quercina L-15889]|uniref:Glycosyltransferase family 49 protein n=1 Tax=Daedalea quercina L-15889 TaxID=1314783 RepID=A0A165QN07_9APHY|nr:glycosyltransferase family 49 protein [Daedalea quercina L-15889]
MADVFLALSKVLRLCLLGYVALAVLYTTSCYVLSPLLVISQSALSFSASPWSHFSNLNHEAQVQVSDAPQEPSSDAVNLKALSLPVDPSDALWPADISAAAAPFCFPTSATLQRPMTARGAATPLQEATLLSKAFAGALHPTRIIPFYYRAAGAPDPDDVTITTLVTRNRFRVFRRLVEHYRGPVSVTVHIPFPAQAALAELSPGHPSVLALQRLHALYTSSPLFAKHVDVHLALSPFAASARSGDGEDEDEGEGEGGRQFNVWRNVARLFARTEFVMMLDVDFAVCTDWRGALREAIELAKASSVVSDEANEDTKAGLASRDVMQRLREGRAALVVPAFEYTNLEDGVDQRTFPVDKESLIRLAQAEPPKIAAFHANWAAGHNSTDYMRYFSIPPGSGEVYRVTHYQSAYEPYVIVSKRVSWCDERFTGYGANKAACLFEMYLSGVSFYVMADHFVIHQTHTYEEAARREERKYNRKLYADFKEEACLRYLFRYAHEGVLHTPRGFNVQEECKKLKGVARIAAQLLEHELNVQGKDAVSR